MEVLQSSLPNATAPTSNSWNGRYFQARSDSSPAPCKVDNSCSTLHQPTLGQTEVDLPKTTYEAGTIISNKLSKRSTFHNSNVSEQTHILKYARRPRPASDLQLPSFRELGISTSSPVYMASTISENASESQLDIHRSNLRSNLRKAPTTPIHVNDPHYCNVRPPPTPPEDASSTEWISPDRAMSKTTSLASRSEDIDRPGIIAQRNATQTTRNIELPLPTGQDVVAELSSHVSWLNESIHTIVSSFENAQPLNSVEVISQVLPSQSKERRSKPTYEEVLTTVQEELPSSPFITITHGVTQAMAMEEIPKTPPTTPFALDAAAHYFADNQTIFSNAAVVPVYHGAALEGIETTLSKPRQISAPFKTNITILERYIPPTNPQEIEDFFKTTSNRSYMADRLPELALGAGSLLLIYPTKKGAETFTQKYIGPVLDPLLRQFVILNNLTVDAAERLGKMTAVEAMLSFEEMKTRVESLCSSMSQASYPRGRRSSFKVAYSEVTEIVLDRETWTHWWIDQEQPRLRQNLVEYHHSGGRMPRFEDERYESTVGMLTRDIIDGVKKSKSAAGSAGVEVGVFVIQRVAA